LACGSVFVIYWLIKHPDRCSEDIKASSGIQERVQLISDIRLNQFAREVPDHALTIEDVVFVSAIEKHIDFKPKRFPTRTRKLTCRSVRLALDFNPDIAYAWERD
jgi:hypothetical protein